MTHAELVERAVVWLRRTQRCRLVLAEIVTYAPCIPDALGWTPGGMTHHVECKVSRSDLLRDRHKVSHRGGWDPGNWRWYALANEVSADGVDESWGILRPSGRGLVVERDATRRDRPEKAVRSESLILLSAFRRAELGVPFDRRRGRFRTIAERDAEGGKR